MRFTRKKNPYAHTTHTCITACVVILQCHKMTIAHNQTGRTSRGRLGATRARSGRSMVTVNSGLSARSTPPPSSAADHSNRLTRLATKNSRCSIASPSPGQIDLPPGMGQLPLQAWETYSFSLARYTPSQRQCYRTSG